MPGLDALTVKQMLGALKLYHADIAIGNEEPNVVGAPGSSEPPQADLAVNQWRLGAPTSPEPQMAPLAAANARYDAHPPEMQTAGEASLPRRFLNAYKGQSGADILWGTLGGIKEGAKDAFMMVPEAVMALPKTGQSPYAGLAQPFPGNVLAVPAALNAARKHVGTAVAAAKAAPEVARNVATAARNLTTDDAARYFNDPSHLGYASGSILGGVAWGGLENLATNPATMAELARVVRDETGAVKLTTAAEQAVKQTFPVRNSYGKKVGFVSPADAIKRLDAAENIPEAAKPEIRDWLTSTTFPGDRVHPGEVQAKILGEEYDPGRLLRGRVKATEVAEGTSRWPGAPTGMTPRHATRRRPGWINQILEGVHGRDFYEKSGQDIYFHTGDNPVRAGQLGENLSVTSAGNEVSSNQTVSLPMHDQAMLGVEIRGGMYPELQSQPVREAYAGVPHDYPKKTPFEQQMAKGGGYLPAHVDPNTIRPVNDIWMGEFFGFKNPDGTPKRSGFTTAQHRWMDEQLDLIINEMNRTKAGGFDDWNTGNVQAAAWTAAKIRAGEVPKGGRALDFSNYTPRHYVQTGRDFVAGGKSGHLPGLKDLPPDQLADYQRRAMEVVMDPQGRDIAAKNAGQLTGRAIEGPGIFYDDKGVKTEVPGIQTRTAVGSEIDKAPGLRKDRQMGVPGNILLQSNEGQYGMIVPQDMIAGTYANRDALAARQNMHDVVLGDGTMKTTSAILRDVRVQNLIRREKVVPLPFEGGIRLLWPDGNDEAGVGAFRKLAKELAGRYGTGEISSSENRGFAAWNPWDKPEGAIGQEYAKLVQGTHLADTGGNIRPVPPRTYDMSKVTEKLLGNFDATAPNQARRMLELDAMASKEFNLPVSQVIQDMRRAIADAGWSGYAAYAKKLGVPLAVVMAFAPFVPVTAPGGSTRRDTGPASQSPGTGRPGA